MAGGSGLGGLLTPHDAGRLIGGMLRLLADQLDRSPAPSVTPVLRIGFAVDSWVGFYENFLPFFRGIPKKGHNGQVGAVIEAPILDAGGALTDRDAY